MGHREGLIGHYTAYTGHTERAASSPVFPVSPPLRVASCWSVVRTSSEQRSSHAACRRGLEPRAPTKRTGPSFHPALPWSSRLDGSVVWPSLTSLAVASRRRVNCANVHATRPANIAARQPRPRAGDGQVPGTARRASQQGPAETYRREGNWTNGAQSHARPDGPSRNLPGPGPEPEPVAQRCPLCTSSSSGSGSSSSSSSLAVARVAPAALSSRASSACSSASSSTTRGTPCWANAPPGTRTSTGTAISPRPATASSAAST